MEPAGGCDCDIAGWRIEEVNAALLFQSLKFLRGDASLPRRMLVGLCKSTNVEIYLRLK